MYQWALSPLLSIVCGPGCGCRFQPTCSHYFLEAVEVHGARRGVVLGVRRLARCHPWGGEGCDPVPRARIDGAVTQLRRSPFEPVSK